jgi:hypothetical protein
MDVRSTDRADLTAKRLEQIAQPAAKANGHASRRHDGKRDEKNERNRDERELETIQVPDGPCILDVKV